MPTITYRAHQVEVSPEETILDAFIRQGIDIPFSCRSGICKTCVMRCTEGAIPLAAQEELSADMAASDHILPCVCMPTGDMVLEEPASEGDYITATVKGKQLLGEEVMQLLLEPAESIVYQAGQFLSLRRPHATQSRCYSIASVPGVDPYLELQIRRMKGGQVSGWVHDELAIGDRVEIAAPQGACHYQTDSLDDPLLLIGAGVGISPLVGILRDALLVRKHRGPIYLYHGHRRPQGLYLIRELLTWAEEYPSFHYFPCVSGGQAPPVFWPERATDLAMTHHPDLSHVWVFACGSKEVVEHTRHVSVAAGLPEDRFFADIFHSGKAHTPSVQPAVAKSVYETGGETFSFPAADLEMWTALGEGEKLRDILEDFYDKVYEDPRLAPFFEHATKARAIQKQYSFLYQVFTGKPVYLGESPRNAHHWMVISDEMFDYRERLFEESIRRVGGMPEHLIQRWTALQEQTRPMLVKKQPWPKILDGEALPLGGLETITASTDMLCDRCGAEIVAGETVRYHSRLGEAYCHRC